MNVKPKSENMPREQRTERMMFASRKSDSDLKNLFADRTTV